MVKYLILFLFIVALFLILKSQGNLSVSQIEQLLGYGEDLEENYWFHDEAIASSVADYKSKTAFRLIKEFSNKFGSKKIEISRKYGIVYEIEKPYFYLKKPMKIIIILLFPFLVLGQNLEVEGKAKITQMDPATADALAVMKETDGTLSVASMSSSSTYKVGDRAQGGVIYWMSSDGNMGKVVFPFVINGDDWSNITTTEIGVKAQSPTNGALNTFAIVKQAGHAKSLANNCSALQYGGFNDWYMPAIDELEELYLNKTDVESGLEILNGDLLTSLLSSTESSSTKVFGIVSTGTIHPNWGKEIAYSTRAVRTFFTK